MSKVMDSIWGKVSSCWEIAPEVYQVEASMETGADSPTLYNGGIMIPLVVAQKLLPKRAIEFGEIGVQLQKQNDSSGKVFFISREFLHYERDKRQLIPIYELLITRKITDYDVIRKYHEYRVINEGRLSFPEYFGEFIFPLQLYLHTEEHIRLENGVWAFRAKNGIGLAVHKTVAYYSLSDPALQFGKAFSNSVVFWKNRSAVALYELRKVYRSIKGLVTDTDSLMDVMKTQFGMYFMLADRESADNYDDLGGNENV